MAHNPFSFDRSDPMGVTYASAFYTLLVCTAVFAWKMLPTSSKALSREASRFQWIFLAAWYVCVFGDWLQGPYVYALYDSYGFSRAEISHLFVAGFGSSMLFGTFVGALGDTVGRKRSCQLYCVLYIVSCFTKHFPSYWILMFGRITGGIATSLLFSSFESWLVGESTARPGFGREALAHTFALMWFGSSLLAILAGLVGDAVLQICPLRTLSSPSSSIFMAATFNYGGYTAPFDVSMAVLALGLAIISWCWRENFGAPPQDEGRGGLGTQIVAGISAIARSRLLLSIMLMVTCFEGSMYTFVFNWTPALQNKVSTPPLGMIFATFLMAYMCGSSCFDLLRDCGCQALTLAKLPLALGALCFVIASATVKTATGTSGLTGTFLCFVVFEFCCGLYFPAISLVKSLAVPEAIRSTVYNIYRVPMNGVVLVTLLTTSASMTAIFMFCFTLLAFAGGSAALLCDDGRALLAGKQPPGCAAADKEETGGGVSYGSC